MSSATVTCVICGTSWPLGQRKPKAEPDDPACPKCACKVDAERLGDLHEALERLKEEQP